MTAKTFATAALGAAVALLIVDSAMAQAVPPRPAATTGAAMPPAAGPAMPKITHGPALPGVCIFNNQGAIVTSLVGKFVTGRLQQLGTAVTSELQGEQTSIETEGKAIDAARSQPGADLSSLQQRQDILQARYNAWQRKAQQREREMQLTQQKALTRIGQEMDPVLIQVYQSKGCSILLNAESVMLGNPSMDITAAVVTGTNAKIQQFTFDRERLDQAAGAAQPKPN